MASKIFHNFHAILYGMLWLGGIISATTKTIFTLSEMLAKENYGELNDFIKTLVIVFIYASFAHIAFAYIDFYKMEEKPEEYLEAFPYWFNSKIETFVRIIAFLTLIVVAGKVVPITDIFNFTNPDKAKFWSFIIGNTILFLLFFLWDVLSVIYRSIYGNWREIFNIRIVAYIVSDLIAFLSWGLLAYSFFVEKMQPLTAMFILISLVVYLIVIVFRLVYMVYIYFKNKRGQNS